MLQLDEIKKIVAQCEYEDWNLTVVGRGDYGNLAAHSHIYLQVAFIGVCQETGQSSIVYCRKWLVSKHSTPTEIVRTVHFAVQTAVLHEFNEKFKYKGVRISNPHIDVEALVGISDQIEKRTELAT